MASWWLGWRWFVTPSGAHPEDRSFGHLLRDAPLLAHSWGAIPALLPGYAVGLRGVACWFLGLCLMGAWQAAKWDDHVYSPETVIAEVSWRLLIGGAAAALLLWIS